MKNSYAVVEVFKPEHIALLERATDIVSLMPAKDRNGEWVRCHELARAVGVLLKLGWGDGYYGMVEHSWLWPEQELNEPPADFKRWPLFPNLALDVYMPGKLPQVQLVSLSPNTPHYYRRGPFRDDINGHIVEWLMDQYDVEQRMLDAKRIPIKHDWFDHAVPRRQQR